MNLVQVAAAVTAGAVGTKVGHVQRNGEGDIAPMLHVYYDDHSDELAVILGADIPSRITGLLREMRRNHAGRREVFVAVIAEAFRKFIDPGELASARSGDARAAYEAGAANASTIITVVVYDCTSGEALNIVLPYHYEAGLVMFTEAEAVDTVQGEVLDAVRAGVLDPMTN